MFSVGVFDGVGINCFVQWNKSTFLSLFKGFLGDSVNLARLDFLAQRIVMHIAEALAVEPRQKLEGERKNIVFETLSRRESHKEHGAKTTQGLDATSALME